MEDTLPIHIWYDIMNKASPWGAYCLALSCKALLQYYESGNCKHNTPAEIGGCDRISSLFKEKSGEDGTFFGMSHEDELRNAKSNTESEDPEVLKAWIAKHRQDEMDWHASQDDAGVSGPLGNLSPGGMTICSIKGRDFTFICDNSDGSRSERRLLLIDDYYRIKKGKKYKSFIADASGPLTRFQACFPSTKQYKPCLPVRDPWDDYEVCRSMRQKAMSTCGLFDGENSEDVQMSPDNHRGYECVGFIVKSVETTQSFRVKLQLYDAMYYCS